MVQDRILIVDFLNFLYRGVISFGAKKDESKPDYTIVYNFFRNFKALVDRFGPKKCFLVLEGGSNFRYTLYPEYKANRLIKTGSIYVDSQRENVNRQADIVCQLLAHLPVTLVKAEEYEADDTIFSLADNLQNEEVIIVSSDSDMIQILQRLDGKNIRLYNATKKDFVSAPSFVYLVWKSLAGDSSDNIPPVTSAKEAELLSQSPGALEEFLSVEENRASFQLNRELIELRRVPEEKMQFTQCSMDFDKLFNVFSELEFESLLKASYREKFVECFSNL